MHKIIQQIPYYIPLLAIFVVGGFGFFSFSYDRTFQVGVIVAIGVSHVVWGVVYHTIHRDLSVLIVLEYLVFALFGVTSVLTVLG